MVAHGSEPVVLPVNVPAIGATPAPKRGGSGRQTSRPCAKSPPRWLPLAEGRRERATRITEHFSLSSDRLIPQRTFV
jgi:hypothetical protein